MSSQLEYYLTDRNATLAIEISNTFYIWITKPHHTTCNTGIINVSFTGWFFILGFFVRKFTSAV